MWNILSELSEQLLPTDLRDEEMYAGLYLATGAREETSLPTNDFAELVHVLLIVHSEERGSALHRWMYWEWVDKASLFLGLK